MFDTDEWDIEKDFLDDIDYKVAKHCFEQNNEVSEPKKRKIENNNDSVHGTGMKTLEIKTNDESAVKYNNDKKSRKNLILGLFNKNVVDKIMVQETSDNKSKEYNDASSNLCPGKIQDNRNSSLPRKDLILGILKKKASQHDINHDIIKHQTVKQEMKNYNNHNNTSEKGSNSAQRPCDNSRKQLLSNILNQQYTKNIMSKNDNLESKLITIKPSIMQPNKRMALVRKFPGPAGLLPDNIDLNTHSDSYLNNLDENETMKEDIGSNYMPQYCSQNTKNLFTEGAWQMMLEDLPCGLLNGHDIATVKEMATLNGFNGTKVQFLAGIIEHIDFSHDNPPVILKDFTDHISGIIHKDIPLKYPGLLEANVVVLLHDVGLLRISGTFTSNKYQILMSPFSLLAIYTNKGTIVRAQHMKSLFKCSSQENEKIMDNSISERLKETQSNWTKNCDNNELNNTLCKNKNIKEQSFSFLTNMNEKYKDINDSFSSENNVSSLFFINENRNLENQKNTKNSVSTGSQYTKQTNKEYNPEELESKKGKATMNDKNENAESLLKSLNRFAPDVTKRKKLCHNSEGTKMDAERPELSNHVFSEKMDVDKCNDRIENTKSITLNKKGSISLTTRSKLQQFRSPDTLNIPKDSTNKTDKKLLENTTEPQSVMQADIDSDDEVLSQLDIDTIFSNYNQAN